LPSDYNTVSPWTSMREMEASMLEEAEAAGDLFLKSGIVASSRYAWGLAVRHYADKFCYGKLKHVYENLARTVVSEVVREQRFNKSKTWKAHELLTSPVCFFSHEIATTRFEPARNFCHSTSWSLLPSMVSWWSTR
jgi:hypothetical protein